MNVDYNMEYTYVAGFIGGKTSDGKLATHGIVICTLRVKLLDSSYFISASLVWRIELEICSRKLRTNLSRDY